jgi:glycosyltransferase involved in cell wall biosynthesis
VGESLIVVTPMWNERRHIEVVARAMLAQTRPPDRWIVVDDGSTDGTRERLVELEREVPFMTLVAVSDPDHAAAADRLVAAGPPRAFNAGLAAASSGGWDFVAKIDGDVELPRHYFERLLDCFAAEPRLGMVGAQILEPRPGGRWRRVGIPSHHVSGPIKLYRANCFADIGGVHNRLGWDTIDVVRARMLGYTTRSCCDVFVKHHRPMGGVGGVVHGHARHGACAWITHYPLAFVLLRSLKLTLEPPRGRLGFAFLYGYLRAAARSTARVDDRAFREHIRSELRGRLRAAIVGAAPRRSVPDVGG